MQYVFLVDSNDECILCIRTLLIPFDTPIVDCRKPSSWSLGGIHFHNVLIYFYDFWRKSKIQNTTRDSWYFIIHDVWFHLWTAFVSSLTHFCLRAHALATQALFQSKQQLLKASAASAIMWDPTSSSLQTISDIFRPIKLQFFSEPPHRFWLLVFFLILPKILVISHP